MHELITFPVEHNQHEVMQEGFAFDHAALKIKLHQRSTEAAILVAAHEQIKAFNQRTLSMAKYLFKIDNTFNNKPRTVEESIHLLDKDYWQEFFEDINLIHLVSVDQLNEMREQVSKNPAMTFTEDVVMSLMGNIWENRNLIFSQKILSVLNNLSRDYKSNTGHGVAAKIVIPSNRGYSINWDTCNALDDLRIAARQIFNIPVQMISSRLLINHGKCIDGWIPVDGDLMRFKVFGNNNIHVWFSDDLVVRFNEILNLVQPNALGEKPRKRKAMGYKIEMKTVLFNAQEAGVFCSILEPILRSGSHSIYDIDLETAKRIISKFNYDLLTVESTNDPLLSKEIVTFTLNQAQRITFIMEMFLGGFEQR